MKKKVYITSLHLQHGGVEMAITLLANALSKRGYEVEILCTYDLGAPVYELDKNVKVIYLTELAPNREEFNNAVKNRDVFRVIKQGIYSIKVLYLKKKTMRERIKAITEGTVIATRNEHAILLSKYGKSSVKKIAQLHHDHCFDKKIMHDFKYRYKNIDVFVLLTEWLCQEIKEIMKNNKHTKHIVIPNFLADVDKTDVAERENQVIAVGRMHTVKGFLRMLEIWKEVHTKEKHILKIIGSGEQTEEICEKIKELHLEEQVIMTGALNHEDVMKEMKKSKIYLMTSYSEAFPFALLEAMQAGLPLVSYDVRVGPRAIIQDGKNGYLIPEHDKKMYVEKVESILDNQQLHEMMSKESQVYAEKFSEEQIIKRWLEIL